MLNNTTTFGNGNQNLILETAGRVYIKVSDKFYELNFRDQTSNKGPAVINNNIVQKEEADLSNYITKRDLKSSLAQYITKRDWQDVKETQRKLEEALLDGFSESINPITVQTMQVIVGSEQLQFEFIEKDSLHPNGTSPYITTPHSFGIQDGRLFCNPGLILHHTVDCPDAVRPGSVSGYEGQQDTKYYCRWHVGNSEVTWFDFDSDEQSYYLYIRAEKLNLTNTQRNDPANDSVKVGNASFFLSAEPYSLDPDNGYYYFLYAIINSDNGDGRSIGTMNGFTEILPGQITAYIFKSADGIQFVDFLNKQFHIGYAPGPGEIATSGTVNNGSYMHWDSHNGLVIKGNITVTGGDLQDTLDDLQRQIDDDTQAWFSGDSANTNPAGHKHDRPTNSSWPANEWYDDETPIVPGRDYKKNHTGDLFYITDGTYEGEAYRYVKDGNSYTWTILADNSIAEALRTAYEAKALAEDAETKFNNWADDGKISPTEIGQIETEVQFVTTDYAQIIQNAHTFGVDTATSTSAHVTTLTSAYNAYIADLNTIITDYNSRTNPTDCVDIPTNMGTHMSAYYSARQQVLIDIATATKTEIAGYSYLKEAIEQGATSISGGLILSNLIELRTIVSGSSGSVTAGLNGIVHDTTNKTDIAAWYGGPFTDRSKYYNWTYNNGWVIKPAYASQQQAIESNPSAYYAQSVFRHNGTGYVAGGAISWDSTGAGSVANGALYWSSAGIVTLGGGVKLDLSSPISTSQTINDLAVGLDRVLSWFEEIEDTTDPNNPIYTLVLKKHGTYNRNFLTYGDQLIIGGTPGGGGGGGVGYLHELWDTDVNISGKPQLSSGQYASLIFDTSASDKVGENGAWKYAKIGGGLKFNNGILSSDDTKNTAGADNTTNKIFLVGPTAQTISNGTARTYSNVNCYASGGKLYSNSKEVVNLSDSQALTNKTYNGYTLNTACGYNVASNLTVTSAGTYVLDAYQGKVLNDKFSNYLPLAGGVSMTSTSKITNLNADFVDGLHASSFYPARIANPANGCLVKTSIATTGNLQLFATIIGSSYNTSGKPSFLTHVQFYKNKTVSDNTAFAGPLVTHYGLPINNVKAFYYNDYLYLWFEQPHSSCVFHVTVSYLGYNYVDSITNNSMPTTGVTCLTEFTNVVNGYNSYNLTASEIVSILGTTAVNRATADSDGNTISTTYVKLNPGTNEQTIQSKIATTNHGVITLWRSSGNHGSFLGFSNGLTETYIGAIGFKSQSDNNLYRRVYVNSAETFYKIWDQGNSGTTSFKWEASTLLAATRATIGQSSLNTNYVLAVVGTSYLNGNVTIPSGKKLTIGGADIEWVPNSGNGYLKINTPLVTEGDQIIINGTPGSGGGGVQWLYELQDVDDALRTPSNGAVLQYSSTDEEWVGVAPDTIGITSAGTVAELNAVSPSSNKHVWTPAVLASWLSGKNYITAADAVSNVAIGTSTHNEELAVTKNGTTSYLTVPFSTVTRRFKRYEGTETEGGYDLNTLILEGGITSQYHRSNTWANGPAGMRFGGAIQFNPNAHTNATLAIQLAWDIVHSSMETGRLWWRDRGYNNSTSSAWWGSWHIIYDNTTLLLNGSAGDDTALTFYAPTTAGTFGQLLKSGGAGIAPAWTSSALGSATKNIYLNSSGVLTEGKTYAGGTAVTLNGTSKAESTASFYAPTASGTSGQVLTSEGSGQTPSWVNQDTLAAGSATRDHLGNTIATTYLKLSGGTMTGDIIIPAGKYIRTDSSTALLGISSGNILYLGPGYAASANFLIRSANIDLKHRKYTDASTYTDYKIFDASNANLSTIDWNCKDLSAAGDVTLANNKHVRWMSNPEGGASSEAIIALEFTTSNNLYIGYGVATSGHFTRLYGNTIDFLTGSTTRTTAFLLSDSNVTMYRTCIPSISGRYDLGSSSTPWGTVYANNANITSKVNIGAPSFSTGALNVNGIIVSSGDQTISSDIRMKTNLKPIELSVEDIAKCRAVTFDWIRGGHSFGSIAQDWLNILPEAVHHGDTLSLAYGQLATVGLINIAKHELKQDKKIKKLEENIKNLELEIKQLKVQLYGMGSNNT